MCRFNVVLKVSTSQSLCLESDIHTCAGFWIKHWNPVSWVKSERTVEKKYFPGRRLLWSRSRRKHWIRATADSHTMEKTKKFTNTLEKTNAKTKTNTNTIEKTKTKHFELSLSHLSQVLQSFPATRFTKTCLSLVLWKCVVIKKQIKVSCLSVGCSVWAEVSRAF